MGTFDWAFHYMQYGPKIKASWTGQNFATTAEHIAVKQHLFQNNLF